jgi:histidine triad (HIT) family protein
VPKKHIRSLNDLTEDDANIIANITLAIPKIAKMSGLEKGFKTLVNTEKAGGQSVFHLHYHILGGTFNKTHGLFHT